MDSKTILRTWFFGVLPIAIIMVCFSCSDRTPAESVARLETEFRVALQYRGVREEFDLYRRYVMQRLQKRGSSEEDAGKCRLQWVKQLVGEPTHSVRQAERFTRELYAAAHRRDLSAVLKQAADRLEANEPIAASPTAKNNDDAEETDPLQIIIRRTHAARQAMQESFHPLQALEADELKQDLYAQTTGEVTKGHRFADKARGRRIADLIDRVDRRQLLLAARELSVLTDQKLLDRLAKNRGSESSDESGIQGKILQRMETPDGTIVIGGPGNNEYRLDELTRVYALVDIGGDDVYIEGTTTTERPVLVILDLAGNDVYRGEKPGIQGGAIMGASLLVDRAGNDTYTAGDVAQGSALAGVGLLIDDAGQDNYRGDRRVQGQATAGCGILIDRGGNDRYRGALLAQGVGGPLGFGLLADMEGSDRYFAGGKYSDPYNDSPGYASFSQGVGTGMHEVASGGIGVLLDGGGSDTYEADYFSHGGGYWFGAGFARDFGGDDLRWGATRENFDGSPRTEPRFLRWGIGYACHFAAGFVFDDSGNDTYNGDWAAIAYGWDVAVAALCDFNGNDRYISTGSGVAEAHNDALAILYDRKGDDTYQGKGLGLGEAHSK